MNLIARYDAMSLPVKAGLWFTVCSIISRGISVISLPLFTWLLSTEQYGQYSLYISWYSVLSLLVTLNLFSELFNKGLSDYEDDRDGFVSGQIGLLTTLVVFFVLLYLPVREPVNGLTTLSTELTLLAFAEAYCNAVVCMWYARKRFEYAYKPLIAVTLVNALSGVVLGAIGIAVSPEEYKVVARVGGTVVPLAISASILIATALARSRKIVDGPHWRATLALAVPLVPHYLSQVLLNQFDKMMINWYCGSVEVAIYSIAHSAGLLLVLVNNGINSAFVPWSYGKLKSGEAASARKVANSLCGIVVLVNAFLMLLAPECVALLATDDYKDAIWCLTPIATSVVFCFVYQLFVNVEIYYGKTAYATAASMAAAALNVVLNAVFIPRFGYTAAAYTTAASYLFCAIMHGVLMVRVLRQGDGRVNPYDLRFLFGACASIVAIAAVSMVLYTLGPVRWAFIVGVAVAVFALRSRLRAVFESIAVRG